MIRILRDLMRPEAQRQPHHWASTLGSHCWVGVGLWGMVAILLDRWTAVYVAPAAYLVCIEGLQLALAPRVTRGLIWDALLDTVAVTLGCIAAAYLADGMIYVAMWTWASSLAVAVAGWLTRDR